MDGTDLIEVLLSVSILFSRLVSYLSVNIAMIRCGGSSSTPFLFAFASFVLLFLGCIIQ